MHMKQSSLHRTIFITICQQISRASLFASPFAHCKLSCEI